MGTLKALLPVAGEAMIRLRTQKLLAAGAEETVVVTGYRLEAIEAVLTGLPVHELKTDDPGVLLDADTPEKY